MAELKDYLKNRTNHDDSVRNAFAEVNSQIGNLHSMIEQLGAQLDEQADALIELAAIIEEGDEE